MVINCNKLSEGSLEEIMSGQMIHNPILQVIQCTVAIIPIPAIHCLRMKLSDGKSATVGAITYTMQPIETFSIIRLTDYFHSYSQTGVMEIVVNSVDIITPGSQVGTVIGCPILMPYLGMDGPEVMPTLNENPSNES